MGPIEWLERALFGSYTGTPEARRDFVRDHLIGRGYSTEVVDRVLREKDERLKTCGVTW